MDTPSSNITRKIVGWFSAVIDRGGFYDYLDDAVFPIYEGETEQETKARFAKEQNCHPCQVCFR